RSRESSLLGGRCAAAKTASKASPEKTCLETDAEVHSKPDRRLALAPRILLESDGDNAFNGLRHRTGGERTVQKRCEAPRRFPGVEGHPHSCAKRVRQRVDDAWMDGERDQAIARHYRHQLQIEGPLICGLHGNTHRKPELELIADRRRLAAHVGHEREDDAEVTAEAVLSQG